MTVVFNLTILCKTMQSFDEKTLINLKSDLIDKYNVLSKNLDRKIQENSFYVILGSAYNIWFIFLDLIVGSPLRAFLTFLAMYAFLNANIYNLEILANLLHLKETFPAFNMTYLTFFLSLATVISASVVNRKKEDMLILEERLALKATSDIRKQMNDIESRLDSFETATKSRFDRLESRFESFETATKSRFDRLESRFDAFEARFETMEETLKQLLEIAKAK